MSARSIADVLYEGADHSDDYLLTTSCLASPGLGYVRDAAIHITGGRIGGIFEANQVPPDLTQIACPPDFAVIPGMVNAHSHLHHSLPLDREVLGRGEASLRKLSERKRSTTTHERARAFTEGIEHTIAAGITTCATGVLIDDVVHMMDLIRAAVTVLPLFSIKSYHSIGERLAQIDSLRHALGVNRKYGIFLHRLPGFTESQLREVATFAAKRAMVLGTHFLENEDEATSAPALLETLSAAYVAEGSGDCLPIHLVHCNYAGSIPAGTSVPVICPRSTAALGNSVMTRLLQWDSACIATDSAATAGSYDLLSELSFLRLMVPEVSELELLQTVTANPAHAMGLADVAGTIKAGRTADLVIVRRRLSSPSHSIIEGQVVAVCLKGRLQASMAGF